MTKISELRGPVKRDLGVVQEVTLEVADGKLLNLCFAYHIKYNGSKIAEEAESWLKNWMSMNDESKWTEENITRTTQLLFKDEELPFCFFTKKDMAQLQAMVHLDEQTLQQPPDNISNN